MFPAVLANRPVPLLTANLPLPFEYPFASGGDEVPEYVPVSVEPSAYANVNVPLLIWFGLVEKTMVWANDAWLSPLESTPIPVPAIMTLAGGLPPVTWK